MRTSRAARREQGAAGVEFLGIVPIVIIALLVALQVGVAGWTVVAVGEAARDGARAASLGLDPGSAARTALPGSLTPTAQSVNNTPDGYRYTVRVAIPSLVPGLPMPQVERSAEMPNIR